MRRLALLVTWSLFALGCAGTQRAVLGPVVMAAPSPPEGSAPELPREPSTDAAPTHRWAVHPERSRFDIQSGDLFGTYASRLTRFRGFLSVGGHDGADEGKVQLVIDMTSLESESRTLTAILQYDFLETDRYPHAYFEGRVLPAHGDPDERHVRGSLELHGVRRPIAFDGSLRCEGETCRFTAAFTIDRHAFDVRRHDKWDWVSKSDIRVALDIRGTRERVVAEPAASTAAP